jgi:hypothetical protein
VVAKLKLKHTRQTEAVRDLLFRINGMPFEQTKRLGGSWVGINQVNQAKQIRELLERFFVR